MLLLLRLLCFLSFPPVRGYFEGTCLPPAPPAGVLAVPSKSHLLLTCSGDVKVNGLKVNVSHRNIHGNPAATTRTPVPSRTVGIRPVSDPSPVEGSRIFMTTKGSRPRQTFPTPSAPLSLHVLDERSRETRGARGTPQWRWNGRMMEGGQAMQGRASLMDDGTSLVLSSVRANDSGNFSCHQRGRQIFTIKVVIADPPETPTLSCFKKSPSSRIRCEWTPQNRFSVRPNCSLFLSKSQTLPFQPHQCSYWARTSRCGCALNYNENELRVHHIAYLCVTNVAGNATSPMLAFTPLSILKPDPPSSVTTQPVEGQPTRIKVSWGVPVSWKSQDNYYYLIYEVKYHPQMSSYSHGQVVSIRDQRSCTIVDAIPGVLYLIQVRTREEYDGQWSAWSLPVYASGWTEPTETSNYDDFFSTVSPTYEDEDGSAAVDPFDGPESPETPVKVSHHIIWVSVLFLGLSLATVAYTCRNRGRFLLKLHSLAALRQVDGSSQPAPKGGAVVTVAAATSEEHEEDDEDEFEGTEVIHFNNTSYFMIPRE